MKYFEAIRNSFQFVQEAREDDPMVDVIIGIYICSAAMSGSAANYYWKRYRGNTPHWYSPFQLGMATVSTVGSILVAKGVREYYEHRALTKVFERETASPIGTGQTYTEPTEAPWLNRKNA